MLKKQKLLIYMPALNEAATISEVIKSIPLSYEGIYQTEILVVNDGSTDNTREEAEKAGATVLSHPQNRGVASAFKTAVDYALQSKATILVSIDADGQFNAEQIVDFVEPILNNQADFCIGNRFWGKKPDNMPMIKYLGNRLVNKIVSFVGRTKINDASCGFRSYSKKALLSLNLQGNFTYTHEVILDLLHKGFRVQQISVSVTYFKDRVSRVADNLFRYGIKTSSIIFNCFKDYRPFPFFMTIAVLILIPAMLLGGFVLVHWIKTGAISPYKSFGFIALALCGLAFLLAVLALVADMLNRLRNNQEKMLFLIKKQQFDND